MEMRLYRDSTLERKSNLPANLEDLRLPLMRPFTRSKKSKELHVRRQTWLTPWPTSSRRLSGPSSSAKSPASVRLLLDCDTTSLHYSNASQFTDKANVMATSRLWRRTVTRVLGSAGGPAIEKALVPPPSHFLADAATFLLMANPSLFNGVCVMDNLFGDLISDGEWSFAFSHIPVPRRGLQ